MARKGQKSALMTGSGSLTAVGMGEPHVCERWSRDPKSPYLSQTFGSFGKVSKVISASVFCVE
jgi:hypothetical protein